MAARFLSPLFNQAGVISTKRRGSQCGVEQRRVNIAMPARWADTASEYDANGGRGGAALSSARTLPLSSCDSGIQQLRPQVVLSLPLARNPTTPEQERESTVASRVMAQLVSSQGVDARAPEVGSHEGRFGTC